MTERMIHATANDTVFVEKQSWPVVMGNLLLAAVAITQMVVLLLSKGSVVFLFVAFAFPGFWWYIQHKHDMSLLQAVAVCLGFNREMKRIKGFLLGVFGGFFMGWYLMCQNTLQFFLRIGHAAKQKKEKKTAARSVTILSKNSTADIEENNPTEVAALNHAGSSVDKTDQHSTEESEDEELVRELLKPQRAVRKGR